jgi:hypothetical protein
MSEIEEQKNDPKNFKRVESEKEELYPSEIEEYSDGDDSSQYQQSPSSPSYTYEEERISTPGNSPVYYDSRKSSPRSEKEFNNFQQRVKDENYELKYLEERERDRKDRRDDIRFPKFEKKRSRDYSYLSDEENTSERKYRRGSSIESYDYRNRDRDNYKNGILLIV